ncbi:MAG: C40 family peptidase [Burkholderiaceae bacterium]
MALATSFGLLAIFWQPQALAAPDIDGDAVTRLLIERGLVSESSVAAPADPSPTLVQRVRDGASDMVIVAMNFLGVPYRRGGSSEADGFDCSGFTRHIFEMSLGLVLPRRVDDQASASGLIEVTRDRVAGPAIWCSSTRCDATFSHVGIYVGDGKFIHSPRSRRRRCASRTCALPTGAKRFTGARRAGAPAHSPTADPAAARCTSDCAGRVAVGQRVPPAQGQCPASTIRAWLRK